MATAATPPRRIPAAEEADPRESEPWFTALPEHAKLGVRQQWQRQRQHAEVGRRRRRDRLVQSAIEGAVVLGVVQFLFYSTAFLRLLASLALGAGLGATWHRLRLGSHGAALAAIIAFFVQRQVCGMGSPVQAIYALIVVVCGTMACAIPRESERMGA